MIAIYATPSSLLSHRPACDLRGVLVRLLLPVICLRSLWGSFERRYRAINGQGAENGLFWAWFPCGKQGHYYTIYLYICVLTYVSYRVYLLYYQVIR